MAEDTSNHQQGTSKWKQYQPPQPYTPSPVRTPLQLKNVKKEICSQPMEGLDTQKQLPSAQAHFWTQGGQVNDHEEHSNLVKQLEVLQRENEKLKREKEEDIKEKARLVRQGFIFYELLRKRVPEWEIKDWIDKHSERS
jgi:hypothetical protein